MAEKLTPLSDLTADFVKSLLDYHPETGAFFWKFRTGDVRGWNEKFAFTQAGFTERAGNIRIGILGKSYLAHRLAFLIMTGEWPAHDVDHKNGIKGDNRWTNLRNATPQENARNRRRFKSNKSGFKGVSKIADSGKWWARITVDRRSVSLGCFETRELAYEAYCNAARNMHGDFASFE